jgi:TolB protein
MLTPFLFACLLAQPPASTPVPPLDWAKLEAPLLTNHRQLTFRDRFVKAGESYFSPDGTWVIFQAIEAVEAGKDPDPYYAMFVARLDGGAFKDVRRMSPPGSANTCGWFHPTQPLLLFGSTITTPKEEVSSGYQRGTSRYRWAFPSEMEVVLAPLAPVLPGEAFPTNEVVPVFSRPNYDAECTFDASGRFVLYAHIEDAPKDADPKSPPKPDANIYIHDTVTKKDIPIVVAPGYDGGPFFSPDGRWICYRSDRRGNDELQLFVAKLAFVKDAAGVEVPTGIEREYQITDNAHVNWCPFFHPKGDFLVYATSEVGHQNYEIFAVEIPKGKLDAAAKHFDGKNVVVPGLRTVRLTHADGADVLPAFNADGTKMIWCSQRGPKIEGEPRASSQVWIADWTGTPFKD